MGLWNKNAKYDETDMKVNRFNPILASTTFFARLSTSMIEVNMNKLVPRTLMNVKDIPVWLLESAMKIVPRIKIINLSISKNLDTLTHAYEKITNKFRDIDNYVLKDAKSKEEFIEKVKKYVEDLPDASKQVFLAFLESI